MTTTEWHLHEELQPILDSFRGIPLTDCADISRIRHQTEADPRKRQAWGAAMWLFNGCIYDPDFTRKVW